MRKPKKLDSNTPSVIIDSTSIAVQRITRMTEADRQNLSTEECLDLIRQLLEEYTGDVRKKLLDQSGLRNKNSNCMCVNSLRRIRNLLHTDVYPMGTIASSSTKSSTRGVLFQQKNRHMDGSSAVCCEGIQVLRPIG